MEGKKSNEELLKELDLLKQKQKLAQGEERDYVCRRQEKIKTELIINNYAAIRFFAKKFNSILEYEDAVSLSTLGFIDAINDYDVKSNSTFILLQVHVQEIEFLKNKREDVTVLKAGLFLRKKLF